jgi:hypothetical protein
VLVMRLVLLSGDAVTLYSNSTWRRIILAMSLLICNAQNVRRSASSLHRVQYRMLGSTREVVNNGKREYNNRPQNTSRPNAAVHAQNRKTASEVADKKDGRRV